MRSYRPDLATERFPQPTLTPVAEMARANRAKLFDLFEETGGSIVYMRGGSVQHRYDTDTEAPFRQESRFWYLSGVAEPDYHLVLDLASRTFHLFTPRRDTQYAVWNGRVRSLDEIREAYAPDELHYDDQLGEVIASLAPGRVFLVDADAERAWTEHLAAHAAGVFDPASAECDTLSLNDALVHCRLHKSEAELERMRYAGQVNSYAHSEVLKALQPGATEYGMRAVLESHLIRHGLLHPAYSGIYASGTNSAILHYVENTRRMEAGELFLIDAGFEYMGYSSDTTRTWPVSGRFTDDQRWIYAVALHAHKQAVDGVAAGARMEDLHLAACRTIVEGLRDGGLLRGTTEELMDKNVFALFFPHGLGHFLGLDTHDPGGYPKGVDRIERPGIRYLRARRELEPGMVVTIEPGVYFIPALLAPAFADPALSPHLVRERIEPLLGFGGIRIEDNLAVTETGHENLTDVVKEIDDIEAVMRDAAAGR